MNLNVFMVILFSILPFLLGTKAKQSQIESIFKRHPEDKCGGTKMFYTPLIRKQDEEELGVCDSSCSSIETTKLNSPGTQRRMHKKQLRRRNNIVTTPVQRDSEPSSTNSNQTSSNLFTCDDTKTWPEEGIPEDVKENFPFNMRTCFYNRIESVEEEKKAQITFEQACKKANGVFVRPFHHTW